MGFITKKNYVAVYSPIYVCMYALVAFKTADNKILFLIRTIAHYENIPMQYTDFFQKQN